MATPVRRCGAAPCAAVALPVRCSCVARPGLTARTAHVMARPTRRPAWPAGTPSPPPRAPPRAPPTHRPLQATLANMCTRGWGVGAPWQGCAAAGRAWAGHKRHYSGVGGCGGLGGCAGVAAEGALGVSSSRWPPHLALRRRRRGRAIRTAGGPLDDVAVHRARLVLTARQPMQPRHAPARTRRPTRPCPCLHYTAPAPRHYIGCPAG
jgi:hypothetical protein